MFRRLVLAASAIVALSFDGHAQDVRVQLDSAMRVAERAGFSGVVRVQRGSQVLLERGYGKANRAAGTAFTPATVVQIGSNTKDFTAVAILQFVEARKIALADPLSKYFANAPADKRGITIQQLMNHRAGFPLGIGGDFEPLARAAFLDRAMHTELLFAPGARESYSNTGFSLLAAIIEQVSGKTYDQYVQDAMLTPLGLRRTGFLLPKFALTDLARGYLAAGTDAGTMLEKAHAADGPYWNLRGNGGMLSTVADMHAFYAALFETEKLLKAPTRALRFDPNEPVGLAGSDGVNFFLYDRFPPAQTEIIIASTNAARKAPEVRRALGAVLGLPGLDGGDDQVARRPGGKLAPEAIASLLRELVKTINSGDNAALRRFITDHFASGADEPTVDERVQRIGRLHEALGAITVKSIDAFPDASVELMLDSAIDGSVLVKVSIDAVSPYRIHGLQVRVGG